MKLKICGMKYQDNINHIAKLQPDYLGFIFHEKSARHFNGNIPELSESIKKVGVFVDESVTFIKEKVRQYQLDAVQLHGAETPEFCKSLRSEELVVIKAFAVSEGFDFNLLKPYELVCDFFLFDTKGKLPGGNGVTFDWGILNHYPSTTPFFLSGGISVAHASKLKEFKKSNASKYCVALDVNSMFELKPGLKSYEALEKFKSLI